MAGGKNRFNRISSKEWLPFQKSWFRYSDEREWVRGNLRFFTTREPSEYPVFYNGPNSAIAKDEAAELGFSITNATKKSHEIQFAFIDIRKRIAEMNPDSWPTLRGEVIDLARELFNNMVHRRFLMVALPNLYKDGKHYPLAWDLALELGQFFTLKDEKIACCENDLDVDGEYFIPSKQHFYCLYFRKDENSGVHLPVKRSLFDNIVQPKTHLAQYHSIPSWFILKPQRRNKKEVLHPAKFPEDLANLFIDIFSRERQNVFDPMSGTGSTQLAAVMKGRNAYGTELSSFFAEIARERSLDYLFRYYGEHPELDPSSIALDIVEADAKKVMDCEFPAQDLIITSPPYWDMLNMKGAENQAKRMKKGLRTNYSEDRSDLGNITDYQDFLHDLVAIYAEVTRILKPGGYMIVVVKNIKKKGKNYPFAWDLAALLQQKLILLPEVFWCQDDISIAPYGYGNTFVSNTFHQYCLIFQKARK
jgi:DNA modification methylase